jgi:hypothetical protein
MKYRCSHCLNNLTVNRAIVLDGVHICMSCRKNVFFDSSGALREVQRVDVSSGWNVGLSSEETKHRLLDMLRPRDP